MREPEIRILRASDVRRSLTAAGDVRTEVAFQNDINALLARFDEVRVPWRALAGPTPTLPVSIVADMTPIPSPFPRPRSPRIDITIPLLRVLDGGAPLMELVPISGPPIVRSVAPAVATPVAAVRAAGVRHPRRRA